MSFVDRLFPQAELEALGNKWHEPAPKRRRLDSASSQTSKRAPGPQQRQSVETSSQRNSNQRYTTTRHDSLSSLRAPERVGAYTTKRSNSDSQALPSSVTSMTNQSKTTTANKSCLPSFIEPSILKNYLRHLHPKDSHRYTDSARPSSESSVVDEDESSPGSLIPDSTPSPASTDNCPSPAAICEQFRSGPFGNLFDGMRLTDNERDLMEDLLSPAPVLRNDEPTGQKRKQEDVQVGLDYFETDESLLQRIFPALSDTGLAGGLLGSSKPTKECDIVSPTTIPSVEDLKEEETVISHRGIVVYDYSSLSSVDDFFDLDEAST